MGERRVAYRIFVGKHEGKRLLGSPRCRREGTVEINLREIGWRGVDRVDMAQDWHK
jgi:hypothetical protein